MAVTVSARSRFRGPSTPALIRAGALCAAAGVGLSITEYIDIGKWLCVAGVGLMIWGLHRFGRTGPDEVIHFELAPARKKKKKKKPAVPAGPAVPVEPASGEGGPSGNVP